MLCHVIVQLCRRLYHLTTNQGFLLVHKWDVAIVNHGRGCGSVFILSECSGRRRGISQKISRQNRMVHGFTPNSQVQVHDRFQTKILQWIKEFYQESYRWVIVSRVIGVSSHIATNLHGVQREIDHQRQNRNEDPNNAKEHIHYIPTHK